MYLQTEEETSKTFGIGTDLGSGTKKYSALLSAASAVPFEMRTDSTASSCWTKSSKTDFSFEKCTYSTIVVRFDYFLLSLFPGMRVFM